jgi:hypothetical protein
MRRNPRNEIRQVARSQHSQSKEINSLRAIQKAGLVGDPIVGAIGRASQKPRLRTEPVRGFTSWTGMEPKRDPYRGLPLTDRGIFGPPEPRLSRSFVWL